MSSKLVRLEAAAGNTKTGIELSVAGEPPFQLASSDQSIEFAPVQICVAGANRSSRYSNRGRRDRCSGCVLCDLPWGNLNFFVNQRRKKETAIVNPSLKDAREGNAHSRDPETGSRNGTS